ncbi:MAG TPA: hypothetical protein VK464_06425 [Symbiobacteriaceae bacterium]|nr:hypothetical protein [Symbiobacteriaceae bacterium]
MASFIESEAYQELVRASRSSDFARQAQIVEQQIASTQGAERAFWLHVRLARKIGICRTPRELINLVPEFKDLVSVPPNDLDRVQSIAATAINLYVYGERSDALAYVLPLLRPHRRALAQVHGIRHNLGLLFVKKRRWHSAYRNLSLCLELWKQQPQVEQESKGGYRYFVHAQRAVAAVALGRYDEAATSIAGAHAVMAQRPPGYFQPAFVSLAEAALAHAQGEYQTARNFLQTANVTSKMGAPWLTFDFLLMAARIARSEGNQNGFTHFCQQARALCAEYDMPLSAAAVEAVANGAEY